MNNQRRKNRELNRLSAYLDHALPDSEQRKLEARLAVDPALREKLENLRRTKLVLSRLSRLKAPRNFTLTPGMVPERQPRRQPLQATLRLASALAAVLLVVLFGAEFILGRIPQPAMLAADAPAMEAARVMEETEPEPLIQWGPPGTGGEAGGYGGDASGMEEPLMQMEAPPEEALPEEVLPEEQPEIQGEQEEAADQPEEKGDLILGINPDQQGEIIASSEPSDTSTDRTSLPWRDTLRWAQIALAAIAVGGGLALLILRQRRRRTVR